MFIRCRFCSELFRDEESYKKHLATCPKDKPLAYERTKADEWDEQREEAKPKPEKKKKGNLEDFV